MSIATTELLTQPTNTFAGLHSQPLGLPGQTDLLAINSAPAAGLILNIASILPHSWPSMSIASAPTIAPPQPNPINLLPVNRVLPNLSTWSFPVANTSQKSIVTSGVPPPAIATSLPTTIPINNSVFSTAPVFPISSGGTVYYVQPTAVVSTTTSCNLPQTSTTFPSATAPTFVPVSSFTLPQPSVNSFTMQDLAQLLTSTKKNHLPEWKLALFNGDPLQGHEWFGQLRVPSTLLHFQTT